MQGYTYSFQRSIYKGQRFDTQIKHNTICSHTLASIRLCLYSLSLTSPEQQYLQRIPPRQRAMTPLPDAVSALQNQAGLFWIIFSKMIDLCQSSKPLKKLFLGHSHQRMSTGRAGSVSVHVRLRQLLWTGPCWWKTSWKCLVPLLMHLPALGRGGYCPNAQPLTQSMWLAPSRVNEMRGEQQ